MRRADYRCEVCGQIGELVGNYPSTVAISCEGCGNTTVHERIWVVTIIVPAGFTRDKINQSMTPRIHTITPQGVTTEYARG